MKIARKIFSILLCVVIVCAMSTTVFAATLDQDNTSGSAPVVYKSGKTTDDNDTEDPSDDTVVGTYTVTIPDFIEAAPMGEDPQEYDVTASDVLIPINTSLTVAIDFDGVLKLTDDDSESVTYEMRANPQSAGSLTAISTGDTILTVAAGDPDATTTSTVGAVLTEKPAYSGIYSSTATFRISVA